MKRSVILGAVLAVTLGLAVLLSPGVARAQAVPEETPELARDWSIRLGPWFFNSNTSRNAAGGLGISGMVERRVYAGAGYDLQVGIGYNGMNSVYSVPIMVNLIAHPYNLRYGIGAGYSFGKRVDGSGTDGVALDLIVGYRFVPGPNPLSVDLRYYFISGCSNELDGWSLTLGIKL